MELNISDGDSSTIRNSSPVGQPSWNLSDFLVTNTSTSTNPRPNKRSNDFESDKTKLQRLGPEGTLTLASSSKSSTSTKTDEVGNPAIDEYIESFLECTICLDFPVSPINSCANGHILCGQCTKKVKGCPSCKLKKLRPAPLGEKLAKKVKITNPQRMEYNHSEIFKIQPGRG